MDLKENSISIFGKNQDKLLQVKGLNRSASMTDFESMGFPNSKMEKWQKSNIRKVLKKDYIFKLTAKPASVSTPLDPGFDVVGTVGFQNASYTGSTNLTKTAQGVLFGSLEAAMAEYPAIVEQHLNKYIKEKLNGLNALNNALFTNGFFLYVPKNTTVELPLYFYNKMTETEASFSQFRNLMIVEGGSTVNVIHSDLGIEKGSAFVNSVSEIFVGQNAELNWYREQDLGKEESLINSVFCYQERDSRFKVINTSLSGSMIRNDVHVKMDGEGCYSDILGLYLPYSGEQVDNQVFVEHAKPNCISNELFKGVLDGNGTSIFNGHILVKQDAQKTNAYQTNRNIVLSDDASAFAKPFLEIYADDVKCSHGATIGQLDQKALFYLRSRGLSEDTAKSFLIKAFVGEVLEACGHDIFRENVELKVKKKLENK
jgi:Fe-S cluster assembly protein SufD